MYTKNTKHSQSIFAITFVRSYSQLLTGGVALHDAYTTHAHHCQTEMFRAVVKLGGDPGGSPLPTSDFRPTSFYAEIPWILCLPD